MLRFWPLLFLIIPLVEIYFLVQVGQQIGAWYTVLLVIVTAVIGVSLLRQQGMRVLLKANQAMQAGQVPAEAMFDGLILAVVGILLVTPGFFTDTLGFVLLIPLVRKVLMRGVVRKLLNSVNFSQSSAGSSSQYQTSERTETAQQAEDLAQPNKNRTIDGEFKRED